VTVQLLLEVLNLCDLISEISLQTDDSDKHVWCLSSFFFVVQQNQLIVHSFDAPFPSMLRSVFVKLGPLTCVAFSCGWWLIIAAELWIDWRAVTSRTQIGVCCVIKRRRLSITY
jgi:hypothetical protein